ncbi:MAG: 4a-hydroxytetrahydrobiopterin dehydratase [Bryobacteraceae bacterium]|nr:4a-hydroxytetrahydrobiopterin dehydratase [Bryobacteraceae bacterium]
MIERLDEQRIREALATLPGWKEEGGKLCRRYEFPSFSHAIGFMAAAATFIEKMDHHPEWSNVYNRVEVRLWTHDAGGITQLDAELARRLEELARRLL